jgi:hypothetical protein
MLRFATIAVLVVALQISAQASTITSALEVDATANQALSYQITADNGPLSFSTSGLSSITGLTLNKTTGLISGTPTVSGSFNVTVNAKGKVDTATKRIKFVIAKQVVDFTSANTASGAVSIDFSFQVASGVISPTYSASGLPPGLKINSKTGLITGQPTTAGVYAPTVTATNATMIATGLLSITINGGVAAPSAVGFVPVSATVGVPYVGAFTAKGASPLTFSISTPLPAGLVATSNGNFITGTPTTPGITTLTVTAVNAFGSASSNVTFTVAPPNGAPLISSPLQVTAEVGESFTYTPTAAGKAPIVFSVDPTLLPRGLAQDSTGIITGVPFDPGTFVTPFSAANATGADNQSLTITVASLAPGNTSASIKFSDGYRDVKQAGGVLPTSSFNFTALVNAPGIDPSKFIGNLNVDVTVGLYEFSKQLGTASKNGKFIAGKSALFNFTATHDGKQVRLGNIAFSLKNGQIKIMARLKGSSAIGGVQTLRSEQLTGLTQAINETLPVKIQIGTTIVAAFYAQTSGTASVKSVFDRTSDTFLKLSTVKLKGSGTGTPSN